MSAIEDVINYLDDAAYQAEEAEESANSAARNIRNAYDYADSVQAEFDEVVEERDKLKARVEELENWIVAHHPELRSGRP